MSLRDIVITIYNHVPNGWLFREIIAWFLVPFVAVCVVPVQLVRSIWHCRVLLWPRGADYNRFFLANALNSLFYRVQSINMRKFGRFGRSPIIGLGDYALSRWFFVTRLSIDAYATAGAVVPILGMFGWLLMHFLWIEDAETGLVFGAMLLAAIGTNFYCNMFFLQNYNVLGWMFLPGAFYAWHVGEPVIALVCVLGMAFTSFTATIVTGVFALAFCMSTNSLMPIWTMVPAGLKIAMGFLPILKSGEFASTIGSIARSIGASRKDSRYHYENIQNLQLWFIYYTCLSLVFVGLFYYLSNAIPTYSLVAWALFILNSRICRFADLQSMLMTSISAGMADVLIAGEPLLLLPLWLLSCPAPRMIGVQNYVGFLGVVPVAKPFKMDNCVAQMKSFLSPVPEGKRVLAAFDDPNGVWEKIFDGLAAQYQLPLFVASERSIHMLPDHWAIYETNKTNTPLWWGRATAEVKANLQKWQAEFVMIYQFDEDELAPEWADAEFEVLSKFSWSDCKLEDDIRMITQGAKLPTWWLLKCHLKSETSHTE